MTTNALFLPPAHLWIGHDEELASEVELFLQHQLCSQRHSTPLESLSQEERDNLAECFCTSCKQIKQDAHPSIVAIRPVKSYTTDDIAIIFERTAFTLERHERFFFILYNAHNLSATTANRLLKTLEEPPTGYHFILLANNENAILPTIRSRCITKHFMLQATDHSHPILEIFINNRLTDHIGLDMALRKERLSDQQSTDLLGALYAHFATNLRTLTSENANSCQVAGMRNIVTLLQCAMKQPPLSGSSTIFWRNLYLSFTKTSKSAQ